MERQHQELWWLLDPLLVLLEYFHAPVLQLNYSSIVILLTNGVLLLNACHHWP